MRVQIAKLIPVALMGLLLAVGSQAATKEKTGATINLAGKQRMLTQKMTKELLLVANGIEVDANKANLGKTTALFQKTLTGLLDGDEVLGLPGTKDQAISEQLAVVQGLWDQYKPVLDTVDTSDAGLAKAVEINLPLLKEMNKAVKMYEKAAK